MFQRKKSAKNDRFPFLKELLLRFKTSSCNSSRETEESLEILAHICNFAYDPSNREHFKKLNIISEFFIFLDKSEKLFKTREFLWSGLSNFSIDPAFQPEIISQKALILKSLEKEPKSQIAIYTILYYISHSQESLISLNNLINKP